MTDSSADRASIEANRDSRLGILVLRYREPLVRYFMRKRVPRETAEDCAQEVFLRLTRTNETTVLNAEAYLFTIAANVLVSFVRKARTRRDDQHCPIDDFSLVSGEAQPDRVFEGRQALVRLVAALAELPQDTREIFLLNREDGLTYTQIAARYALSVKVIERHMVRALDHLRVRFPHHD